jgi:hypothetical protein
VRREVERVRIKFMLRLMRILNEEQKRALTRMLVGIHGEPGVSRSRRVNRAHALD